MGNKLEFISDINQFIERLQFIESTRDSINCSNCFCSENLYIKEESLIKKIQDTTFTNTKQKGDCLEELIKLLFSRVKLIHTPKITNLDSSLGQIDIQIVAPDIEAFFGILGIHQCLPHTIIGECKNWTTMKVGREDIEKICWRTCKGGALAFFFAFQYTSGAFDAVSEFNIHGKDICSRCGINSLIIPITIDMLSTIIENKINFCYFLQWSIHSSRLMSNRPYL